MVREHDADQGLPHRDGHGLGRAQALPPGRPQAQGVQEEATGGAELLQVLVSLKDIEDDTSGRLKPPLDLVPTVLEVSGLLLKLPTAQPGIFKIQVNGRFLVKTFY